MLTILLALAPAIGDPVPADSVPIHVDARVELLTLVFRLIGSGEFNQPTSRSPYADELELWFGPAREHEAIQRARVLRSQHGIGFNAVPDLAVHLTAPPELALRVPLEPWPERLDERWKGADVEGFLVALRSFAAETSFLEFLASFEAIQRAAEASLAKQVEQSEVLPWLRGFFGEAAGTSYTAVPGLLCGPGNFGASVRLADGTLELWPILGASKWDAEGHALYDAGVLPTIVHEFTHAYSNPVVDRHWAALEPSFERLFPPLKNVMARQAYGTPKTVAYEALVRACVVRHAATHLGAAAAERQITEEASRGFAWTADLAHLLEQYEAKRAEYPDLGAFGPEIARFFAAVAEKGAAPR
jgi:uncharacterized protein DUF4932